MNRAEKLSKLIKSANIAGVVLNPGSSLTYLTGLHFHLMERPTVLIFAPPAKPVLILPELESAKLSGSLLELVPFTYGDNPSTWGNVFSAAINSIGLEKTALAVEPTRLRFLELNYLQTAAPSLTFINGEALFARLRIQKDNSEVADMRQAVRIAEAAFLATLPGIKPGCTEREVAAELTLQLIRTGSDAEMPFEPIIASGPNSANPHAVPSDRKLQSGDLVVVDWGASFHGYVSDLTRTLAIGEVEPELRKIASVVERANAAGRMVAVPGLSAGAVDRAARQVITEAGYGEYFIHRTGHGLGMEGHEPPYMFGENEEELLPGMTFTVEPGIYLPGRGGVRIEDDVVITAEGAETLSSLPRELYDISA